MLGFLFGLIFGAIFSVVYDFMYGKDSTKALAASIMTNTQLSSPRLFTAGLTPSSYAAATAGDRTSGSFLSDVIAALWAQVNLAVSTEVKNTVEPMFKDLLPGPLKTLHFTKLSLGEVPLRLDNCIVHECKTNKNGTKYVQIEIDVVWDGLCDIELKADYVGKLGVQHLKLAGRLSLLLQPIIDTIPVVGAVQFGFVNPPTLQLDFTGLANVADVSTIKTTINTTISDILAGMLVLPHRMMTKLDDKVSYFSVYQPPLGVARLSILRGRGFQVEQRTMAFSNDVPDVYCTVAVGATTIWTTAVIRNSLEPKWAGETADALLDDYNQIITIQAFDKDDGTIDSDDQLGSTQLTVGELLLAGNVKEVELQDTDGRGTGAFITVHCELLNLVAGGKSTDAMKQMNQGDNEKKYKGLLTILISRAVDLPQRSDKDVPELYFCKATYDEQTFYTAAVDGQTAVYDRSFRVPLMETEPHPVYLSLFKGTTPSEKGINNVLVGTFSIPHEAMLAATGSTVSACCPVRENGPSLEYSVSVCGLVPAKEGTDVGSAATIALVGQATSTSAGSTSTAGPDKGTPVDVTIEKAWGLKAESRGLLRADIPDAYVRLTFGSSPRVWRTKTIKNSYTPFWQETQQFEMRDHSQIVNVEVWDEDSGSSDKDDMLGAARVSVGKILLAGGGLDVELQDGGKPCGIFVTIRCGVCAVSVPVQPVTKAENKSTVPAMVDETVVPTAPDNVAAEPPGAVATAPTAAALQTENVVDPPNVEPTEVRFCLTVVNGSGFQVEKSRFGKKDIPDVYCQIKVGDKLKWRTKTIKNDLAPAWNESQSCCVDSAKAMIQVKVYDEDDGIADKDDFLGMASLPVGTLLSLGTKELDLLDETGASTGCVVTFKCSAE